MKDDLNASEKRLIAALDRLDRFIDRAGQAALPPDDRDGDSRSLSDELAALHDNQAAMIANFETRLAEADDRLGAATDDAARLVSANDALTLANRALMDGPTDDARVQALEAEIAMLRATHAAEVTQMGDIVDTLDRMLGTPTDRTPTDRMPVVETPVATDAALDDALAAPEPERG